MFGSIKKYKKQIISFRARFGKEYKETALMLKLLYKQAKTAEEKKFIRLQMYDIAKISVVFSFIVLPGGSLAVAVIETGLQKMNRTIFPSAFRIKTSNVPNMTYYH